MPAKEEQREKENEGLTPRQQRKALQWLNELARGERNAVVLRFTKGGALQDCVREEFVKG